MLNDQAVLILYFILTFYLNVIKEIQIVSHVICGHIIDSFLSKLLFNILMIPYHQAMIMTTGIHQ